MGQVWARPQAAIPQAPGDAIWAARNEHRPLQHDMMGVVFGFLSRQGLCVADLVNRYWATAADSVWERIAREHRFFSIPRDISHKQYIAGIYQFGAGGWLNTFGVGLGAIPDLSPNDCQKLSMSDPWDLEKTVGDTSVFMYLPSVVTMTVTDSPMLLVRLGKVLKLVKGPNMIKGMRILQVPVTLRNLGIMFEERCLGDSVTGYDSNSWDGVLRTIGDEQVTTPGWRLLRKEVVEVGHPFPAQKAAIQEEKWLHTPLIERVCLNLLMWISQQHQCDRKMYALTATAIYTGASRWSTTTWWPCSELEPTLKPELAARLALNYCRNMGRDQRNTGVAVGLPIGDS